MVTTESKPTTRKQKGRQRGNGQGSVYFDPDKGYWYARVPAGHDANGKLIRHKSRGFKTKGDADAACREMLTALGQGIGRDAPMPTFGNWLDQWLAAREGGKLAPKTWEYYSYAVALTKPALGALRLDKLTATDLDRFFAALLQTGGQRGQGLAPRTVKNTRAALHNACERAVRKGLIRANPVEATDPIEHKREPVQPYSEGEANQLLDVVDRGKLAALYYVAVYLGLREGELLGLRWQDVDLGRGLLRVRQQLQEPRVGSVVLRDLKTRRSRRDLDIPEEVRPVLRAHQDRQRLAGQGKKDWNKDGLVFCSEAGTPMRPTNLRRHYKAALAEAGLPDRTFHNLRHTAATLMFGRGLTLERVSRILGHASVTVTEQIYLHWAPTDTRELSQAMSGLRRAASA